jgi:hypothetical protein
MKFNRRHAGLLLSILISASKVCGQYAGNPYPVIKNSGKNYKEFIPANWKIRDILKSDLNSDKITDYAIVLQSKDSARVPDSCESRYPFYPKMLIIILSDGNGNYKLSGSAWKLFGNCNDGVQGQNQYQSISKNKNSIVIEFEYGGSLRELDDYYFKYKENKWIMVYAGHKAYQQGQADRGVYHLDVDLMTKSKVEYESDEKGKMTDYKKSTINTLKPIPLESFDGNFPVSINY